MSTLTGSSTDKLPGPARPAHRTYRWRNLKTNRNIQQHTNVTGIDLSINDTVQETQATITYFKMFFSDEMISHTNLYSAQTKTETGSTGVNKNEIERYIGLLHRMSIFPAHYYRFY